MGSYDLYVELDLDPLSTCAEIASILDQRIRDLLDDGLSALSPEVDQTVTARAVLADPVKRASYDEALRTDDGLVTVTWLHLLADARKIPPRALGTPAETAGRSGPVPEPRRSRPMIRPVALCLILVGGLVAVLCAAFITPGHDHAVEIYLRILVIFLGYIGCVFAFSGLMRMRTWGEKQ